MRSLISVFPFVVAAACLSACGPPTSSDTASSACRNRASDKIGGRISLVSHTGEAVTQEDFKGSKSLVFFGFTYCPDICPATLFLTGTAMSRLPEGVEAPRTIFISVDPDRDTPETMARYIASNGFPENIVGLTGTMEQVQAASDAFIAPFERIEDDSTASGYLVNHSALLYLLDEDWKFETFFRPDEGPDEIAACIADLSKPDQDG